MRNERALSDYWPSARSLRRSCRGCRGAVRTDEGSHQGGSMSQRRPKLLSRVVPAAAIAVIVLVVASCGSSNSSSSSSGGSSTGSSSSSGSGATFGLAQPDPQNDHSFGQATHNGAALAEKQLGIKLTEIDSLTTPSTQLTALENPARTNQVVMMDGAISSQSISSKFPNTQFVVTDGTLPAAPNNHSVTQDWHPVSYLAGVAAAHLTKTHVIGFIGGIPITVITTAPKGYAAGA